MKIYEFTGAPNPRRVRVFLAEKGINNVPSVQVNIATGENRKPEFLKINPMGGLPVLELDDGTLNRGVGCDLPLLRGQPSRAAPDGHRREGQGRRRDVEPAHGVRSIVDDGGLVPQHERLLQRAYPAGQGIRRDLPGARRVKRLEWLDTVLADREFIAGPRFTIADITALIGIDFGRTTANQDSGESEEPRALASGSIEPSEREGIVAIGRRARRPRPSNEGMAGHDGPPRLRARAG